MMEAAKKIEHIPSTQKKSNTNTLDAIRNRKLSQLYIGLTGPTGSGATLVSQQLKELFEAHGYRAEIIKVSDLIRDIKLTEFTEVIPEPKNAERIIALQNKGDTIRKKSMFAIAQLVCTKIADIRKENFGANYFDPTKEEFTKALESKIVFIFDSLKNPYEVQFLKEIYKNSFYLFGLLSLDSTCKNRFVSKGYNQEKFHEIFDRDAASSVGDHGQNVQKTLQMADVFINNNKTQIDILKSKLERYVCLITSSKLITPTSDETAMHHAYVAGARSACLSRQVGAAIVSKNGNVISTGCNDVPRAGGGLYSSDQPIDQRCYNKGARCYNDQHKLELYTQIFDKIKDHLKDNTKFDDVKKLLAKTKVKDLIEFSRAVHAEMDAIVKIAADTGTTTRGAILYTTTFPCHNCARHIVSAGISKVFYIEPYVKSLAPKLHDDSISLEEEGTDGKVSFLPYEGVAPRRYLTLFEKIGWKDTSSGMLQLPSAYLHHHTDRIPIDRFYELELKASKDLGEQLGFES